MSKSGHQLLRRQRSLWSVLGVLTLLLSLYTTAAPPRSNPEQRSVHRSGARRAHQRHRRALRAHGCQATRGTRPFCRHASRADRDANRAPALPRCSLQGLSTPTSDPIPTSWDSSPIRSSRRRKSARRSRSTGRPSQSSTDFRTLISSTTSTPRCGCVTSTSRRRRRSASPRATPVGTGAGIVAIIDTGVDPNHPVLDGAGARLRLHPRNRRFGIRVDRR